VSYRSPATGEEHPEIISNALAPFSPEKTVGQARNRFAEESWRLRKMKTRIHPARRITSSQISVPQCACKAYHSRSSLQGWTVAFPKRILEEYTDLDSGDSILETVLSAVEEKMGRNLEHSLALGISLRIQLLNRRDRAVVELDIIAYRQDKQELKVYFKVIHERQLFKVCRDDERQ
jgi:hypothetical protein